MAEDLSARREGIGDRGRSSYGGPPPAARRPPARPVLRRVKCGAVAVQHQARQQRHRPRAPRPGRSRRPAWRAGRRSGHSGQDSERAEARRSAASTRSSRSARWISTSRPFGLRQACAAAAQGGEALGGLPVGRRARRPGRAGVNRTDGTADWPGRGRTSGRGRRAGRPQLPSTTVTRSARPAVRGAGPRPGGGRPDRAHQPGDRQARHPRRQAQHRRAVAAAEVERALAGPGRHGGGPGSPDQSPRDSPPRPGAAPPGRRAADRRSRPAAPPLPGPPSAWPRPPFTGPCRPDRESISPASTSNPPGARVVVLVDHQPSRQDADAAFQDRGHGCPARWFRSRHPSAAPGQNSDAPRRWSATTLSWTARSGL